METKNIFTARFGVYLAFVLFLMIIFSGQVFADTVVSKCMQINKSGNYTLTGDILASASDISLTGCIDIFASRVVLNCNGNRISSTLLSSAAGIYSNSSYTEIRNCKVSVNFNSGIGLYLKNASYSKVSNSSFNSSRGGIKIENSNNLFFKNVTANYNRDDGIIMISSKNNTFDNILLKDNLYSGMYMNTGSNGNIFKNLAVYRNNNGIVGIEISASNNNLFSNLSINISSLNLAQSILSDSSFNVSIVNSTIKTNNNGVFLEGCNNWYFTNNTFFSDSYTVSLRNSKNISFRENTFYTGSLKSEVNSDAFVVDSTYNLIQEIVNSQGNLTRAWSFRGLIVNNLGQPLPGVKVEVYLGGNYYFNTTSSQDGMVYIDLPEYINNNGVRSYFQVYTLNFSKGGYENYSITHNSIASTNQVITLSSLAGVLHPADITAPFNELSHTEVKNYMGNYMAGGNVSLSQALYSLTIIQSGGRYSYNSVGNCESYPWNCFVII